MRLFHVVGNDSLLVTRNGDFYTNDTKNPDLVQIPKHLKMVFAKYVLNTFIGPMDGKIIFINNDCTDISSDNLCYELNVYTKSDSTLLINGDEFAKINGYEKYFISKNGVVYSSISDKLLKLKINPWNYYSVGITNDNGMRKFEMIHRLVYETWVGLIPANMQVNHIDSKPWMNNIGNLEITTAIENTRHSIIFNNRYSKWNADDVYNICAYLADGMTSDEIYDKMDLKKLTKKKHFRSFCSYLKAQKKYWVDISSQFDFSNAHGRTRKYDDDFINKVLQLLKSGLSQKDIAEKCGVDFRVISDIKRGIKKPLVYYD